jgi:hypothetical protein
MFKAMMGMVPPPLARAESMPADDAVPAKINQCAPSARGPSPWA